MQLILLMSKNINRASLVKSGLTILTAVSICIATLAVLRPWIGGVTHNAQFLRHPIGEAIEQQAETITIVAKQGKTNATRSQEAESEARAGSLPDKQDPVPLP